MVPNHEILGNQVSLVAQRQKVVANAQLLKHNPVLIYKKTAVWQSSSFKIITEQQSALF